MNVTRTTQFAWLCSFIVVLSFAQVSLAAADEAIASDIGSDTNVTSAIFISDNTPSDPPHPPQSVEGSIVFIEDTPLSIQQPAALPHPTVLQPLQTLARGDLKVVSNRQTQPALKALPKATIKQVATVQPVAAPRASDQLGDVQLVVHAEAIATDSPTTITPVGPVAKLLIAAHNLSNQSQTAEDYSQIIQKCAEAIRQGAKDDQRGFALQLNSWALNRRGQLRSDEGEQNLAAADFQAALDFNPRNWRALHNRGVSFAQTGQFAEAFDDFNTVVQLNPQYAKAYGNRATLYVQAKDLQAAIDDYQQAIERDPKFTTAYVGLGRVCHMLGRWDDAIEHFTAAIQLEPTRPDILCSRGDLQADMGLYGEALADYARTIELDPEFAHAYRNGAWLLATCPDKRFRDPENAVLGAQEALEYSYGKRHVALDTLAAALASNGQFDEAISRVTEAVDLAPEDAKFSYLSRLELYQDHEPFRSEPVGDVSQVAYEASDK